MDYQSYLSHETPAIRTAFLDGCQAIATAIFLLEKYSDPKSRDLLTALSDHDDGSIEAALSVVASHYLRQYRERAHTVLAFFGVDLDRFHAFVCECAPDDTTTKFVVGDHHLSFPITDEQYMGELIDIAISRTDDADRLVDYIVATGAGQRLYPYRERVATAIGQYHGDRPDLSNHYVAEQIRKGHVATETHLFLAELSTIANAVSIQQLSRMRPRCLTLLRDAIAATYQDDYAALIGLFPSDALVSYFDTTGRPLPGAVCEQGTWSIVPPDGESPLITGDQRDYISHYLLPAVYPKLVSAFDAPETGAIIDNAPPATADALITLRSTIQN